MAAVVINLEGGNSGILGDVNNVTAIAAGVIAANAIDYDDASLTGISVVCPHERNATEFNGHDAGATQLIQDINQNGHWYQGIFRFEITVPANFASCDITPHLATDFMGQESLVVRINGVEQVTGWNATANEDGLFPTIAGVTANNNQQIIVEIDNSAGSGYVYCCGLRLLNIAFAVPSNTIGQIIEVDLLQSISDGSPGVQTIGQIIETNAVNSLSQGSGVFTDYFNGSGFFNGWNEFNLAALPNAARVDGQFRTGVISAQGSTLWWQGDRGYLLWKEVPFPDSGFIEIIAYNLGIGPASDPTQNKVWDGNSDFSFGTLLVHDIDENRPYWEKFSIGNRADSNPYTGEAKRTTNGVSQQFDVGANAFGIGATKADVRLRITSNRELLWAFRPVGGSTWTVLNSGTGYDGKPYLGDLPFSGDSVRVGLTGYAYANVATPFVAHCDAIVMTGESLQVVQTIGQITEFDLVQSLVLGSGLPVSQVIGQILERNSMNSLVGILPVSQIIGQIVEEDQLYSLETSLTGFWLFSPPHKRIINLDGPRHLSKDKDAQLNYWLFVGDVVGNLSIDRIHIDPDTQLPVDAPVFTSAGLNDQTLVDDHGNTYAPGTVLGLSINAGSLYERYNAVIRFFLESGETDDRTLTIDIVDL